MSQRCLPFPIPDSVYMEIVEQKANSTEEVNQNIANMNIYEELNADPGRKNSHVYGKLNE